MPSIRSPRRPIALLALLLALGGGVAAFALWNRPDTLPWARWGARDPAGAASGGRSAAGIVVTGDNGTGALPAGCAPREVAQLFLRFLDAYNRGDQGQLAGFVFRSPIAGVTPSQWYSVSGDRERPFTAYDLNSFLAHAAERHGRRERLRLLAVSVSGPTWHGGADVVFALARTADDRRPSPPGGDTAVGKGAINCADQTIPVWSLTVGTGIAGGMAAPCPEPPRGTPPDAVVACAARGA